MRVLVFGDSIAQGFWDTEGGWVERLRRHYDGLALKDLKNSNQPEIFNLGVSGDTSRNLLGRIENETKARKWPSDPQTAVIAIGTNDNLFQNGEQPIKAEELRGNIMEVIGKLSSLVERLMFVGNSACDEELTTPVFWSDIHYTNEQMRKYENVIADAAKEKGIPFVPIFEKFKSVLDSGADLLADGLHPNGAGHQLMFELIQPELDKLINT